MNLMSLARWLVLLVFLSTVRGQDSTAQLQPQDTIAWLGGAQVVAVQRSGLAETLVA